MDSPILLKETLVFFVLQCVQLVNILVFEAVLVCFTLSLDQSFLNQWLGIFGFFWNNPMLAENIVPICISCSCELELMNSL